MDLIVNLVQFCKKGFGVKLQTMTSFTNTISDRYSFCLAHGLSTQRNDTESIIIQRLGTIFMSLYRQLRTYTGASITYKIQS